MSDSPKHILLVEDNPIDARSIRRALATDGNFVDVVHVEDMAAAGAACATDSFDAILLDLSLPDSEGLDSLSTLTEIAPATPIIVLTGLNDPEAAVAAVEQGAQDFLDKGSITPDLVARALRYAMARHHSEAELRRTKVLLESVNTREEIARDLHDTVIQRLFALGLRLQAARGVPDHPTLVERVDEAVDEIDATIRDLREAIFGLHQAPTDTLRPRIEEVADRIVPDTIECQIDIGDAVRVDDELGHDLEAVVSEALSNAVQHGQAERITVTGAIVDHDLVLSITDDGIGLAEPSASENQPGRGRGLVNMATRVERQGGTVRIAPQPDRGTIVEVRIPGDS